MFGSLGKSQLQALYQRSFREEAHAPGSLEREIDSLRDLRVPARPPGINSPRAAVGLVIRYGETNESNGPLDFLLTRRADSLRHHPSEVCLPGGAVDAHLNETPHAALDRELFEEVGIPTATVEWESSPWSTLLSLHGFEVSAYLGFAAAGKLPRNLVPQLAEVAAAEWLPFAKLFEPKLWRVEEFVRPASSERAAANAAGPTASAEPRTLRTPVWDGWSHRTWGLTAAFLALLVRRISGPHSGVLPY